MTVNGKISDITLSDFLEAGKKMGIKEKKCMEIISEVNASVNRFDFYAEQANIREKTMTYIKSVIDANGISI